MTRKRTRARAADRPSVLIVLEYIATYRVPLFDRMRELAEERGFDLRIGAGAAQGAQHARGDAIVPQWQESIQQREFRVLGRRITWRRVVTVGAAPDLLVMDQARRNLDVYRLLLPRGMRSSRLALWGHGRDYVQQPSGFDRALLRLLTRRADWFFAYSPSGGRAAVEAGLPADRVTVLFNTVDTRALTAELAAVTEEDLAVLTDTVGSDGPIGLFLGGLDRDKRLRFLVDAADRVVERLPKFRLVIGGTGADGAWLEEAARSRPWIVLLGRVDGERRAVALRMASVLCMPGRVGLVAVDSLAAGVPIVTTRFEGHAPEAEYLEDGIDSVWTEDRVDAYADGLVQVLEDETGRARLVAAARDRSSRFSIEAMAERYVDGIEGALRSSP